MNDGLILVTGSEGLMGSRFTELYPDSNKVHAPKRIEFDISEESQIKAILTSYKFKAIVHFASKTNVLQGEKERDNKNGDFWKVNYEGAKNLANAASQVNPDIQFILISTDLVFPGTTSDPGPYSEKHPVPGNLQSLTWFGYTKAMAEKAVLKVFPGSSVIVRVSNPSRLKFEKRLDFLRSIVDKYDKKDFSPYISNQHVSITNVEDVCKSLEIIVNKKLSGVFHVSSSNTSTPYEIATYLLSKLRGLNDTLPKIAVEELENKVKTPGYLYPKWMGLNVSRSEKRLTQKFGTWREIIDSMVNQGLGD